MTPERQRWWDSLPSYEKQARNAIKESKRKIKWAKEELPGSFGYYGAAMKDGLRRNKFLIKALRKQIAMRPIMKRANGDDYRKCPHCGRYLWRIEDDIYYDYPPKYCEDCGQKLRWA